MTEAELQTLPSSKLFGRCASRCAGDQYWEELVRRFNGTLVMAAHETYQRFVADGPPSTEVLSHLLCEIYLKLLDDRCAILRQYRGSSDKEAEVYLTFIAVTVTLEYLRSDDGKRQLDES